MGRRQLICVLFVLFICGGNLLSPVRAEIGSPYSLLSFRPFLEKGYNTHLGWQGWPVSIEDPHLYRHAPRTHALLAEVEFGLDARNRIHTQILKWYQPLSELSEEARIHFVWFGLEASQQGISEAELRKLVESACQREFQVHREEGSDLFVTLLGDSSASYLRISRRGNASAPDLNNCQTADQE